MQQDPRVRGDGVSRGEATLPEPLGAERLPGAGSPSAGSVAGVPDDQLWRAAILAARAAAITAAELRRSLDARRNAS